MPKKSDPSARAKNAIADNLQIYQHMNFLHQAAILLSSLPVDSQTADSSNTQQAPNTHDVASRDNSAIINKTDEPALAPLSRYYCNTMKNISKKLVLRLDPNVKRSICKKCDNVLIPSVTSDVRVKSRPHKGTAITCKSCRTQRRLVAKKGYELWTSKANVHLVEEKNKKN
ncbi:hypothetical protein K450DRAFT_225853 [Umbelopsis ramanniana AG]|uniref:Uncharacterized protein n=1 Tax=Umbelopsis ramanniana AG TaxID=1314678 RepID=A0AAD5EHG9_UMBRA|nr:uncharacterized protein K450DRAFT_225853 [Umbelopsis ramanniana AG]KAI8583001.1 hypothetical protein K450DRAFT_225853 [Umbelopsis ramanniana AG]